MTAADLDSMSRDEAAMPVPIGTVAVSLKGHDRGRVYLVIGSDEAFLYLTDGDKRPFSEPKKKRRRHISAIGQIGNPDGLIEKVKGMKVQADRNALIRRELRGFTASHVRT